MHCIWHTRSNSNWLGQQKADESHFSPVGELFFGELVIHTGFDGSSFQPLLTLKEELAVFTHRNG